MRNFNDTDKRKKQARIKMPENPAGLSDEMLVKLTDKVKASLHDGSLACIVAFRIAHDAGVPKIAVGEIADKLGIRVTKCQIGCFKVEKIIHETITGDKVDGEVLLKVEALSKDDALTCANVFDLARQLGLTPMAVVSVANAKNMKVHHCQLGCF
jgi:hypothetical protein